MENIYLKLNLYLVAAVFVILLNVNSIFAEDKLNFAVEDNVFPYSFTENGERKGIDYDIIIEAAKRMKIQIDITFVPWIRMMKYVKAGNCDAGCGVFYKKERETFGIYAMQPLHYSKYCIFVKKGSEFKFETIKDLYGKKIGNVRGYKVSEEFDKAVSDGKIITEVVTSIVQNIKKLKAGRVDCVLGNHDLMLYKLKLLKFCGQIVALPRPIEKQKPVYLIFSKAGKNIVDKKAFVKKFNTVLEKMVQDGTFQKIYNKYLK